MVEGLLYTAVSLVSVLFKVIWIVVFSIEVVLMFIRWCGILLRMSIAVPLVRPGILSLRYVWKLGILNYLR